jgi:hypothetical protein
MTHTVDLGFKFLQILPFPIVKANHIISLPFKEKLTVAIIIENGGAKVHVESYVICTSESNFTGIYFF